MTIKADLAGTDCVFELQMYGGHLADNAMGVLEAWRRSACR